MSYLILAALVALMIICAVIRSKDKKNQPIGKKKCLILVALNGVIIILLLYKCNIYTIPHIIGIVAIEILVLTMDGPIVLGTGALTMACTAYGIARCIYTFNM